MSVLEPVLSKLTIQTKQIGTTRLELNWCQRQFLQVVEHQLLTTGRIRVIVLKARQIGISTLTEAILFTLTFLFNRYKGLIVAHDSDSSEGLLGMTNLYWETAPWHDYYSTKHLSTAHVRWRETQSSIKVATAGNKNVGRSKTIHGLHASEFAFWPTPSETMLSLHQTIPQAPGTMIAIESTANGIGNAFHTTWLESRAGENEYHPLFFPWTKHPEYRASASGLTIRSLGHLDDEERALVAAFDLDDDQLLWRRWAIANKCGNNVEKFHQEYPVNETEAFISTGYNVFPFEHIVRNYRPMYGDVGLLMRRGMEMTFAPAQDGHLRVFKYPHPDPSWGQYMIAVDSGLGRGDWGVIQVLNRHTLEQVAVYRAHVDPASIAEEAFKLGIWYNQAIIAPEKQDYGGGQLVVGKLLGMQYPRVWHHAKIDKTPGLEAGDTFGWATNMQTKQVAIGYLLKCLIDSTTTIHDEVTYQEIKNYTKYENGEMGPADTEHGHDDAIMSYAIAITCHFMSPPIMPYGASSYDTADGTGVESDNMLDSYGLGAGQLYVPWDDDEFQAS